jgi:anti-anti-sigma factor
MLSGLPRRQLSRYAVSVGPSATIHWSDEARDGAIIETPHGRVDEASWQAFGDHLGDSVSRASVVPTKKLIINLAALDYMSSRGLRALTLAKREAEAVGVTIMLASPSDIMREILAISRYDKLFAVTETIEGAL